MGVDEVLGVEVKGLWHREVSVMGECGGGDEFGGGVAVVGWRGVGVGSHRIGITGIRLLFSYGNRINSWTLDGVFVRGFATILFAK